MHRVVRGRVPWDPAERAGEVDGIPAIVRVTTDTRDRTRDDSRSHLSGGRSQYPGGTWGVVGLVVSTRHTLSPVIVTALVLLLPSRDEA